MELNQKLAEWAGFRKHEDWQSFWDGWRDPVGFLSVNPGYPDFTDSLDSCFKWLVPKLDKKVGGTDAWITGLDITFSYGAYQGGIILGGVLVEVLVKSVHHTAYDSRERTPALALCKAIEKLIDDGAK